MNKYTFLFELKKELSFMSPEDRESAVRYYEEFFTEAGSENESKIIEELAPVSRLVSELRAEYESGEPELTGRDLTVSEAIVYDEPEASKSDDGYSSRSGSGRAYYNASTNEKRQPYGTRSGGSPPPYGSRSYGGPTPGWAQGAKQSRYNEKKSSVEEEEPLGPSGRNWRAEEKAREDQRRYERADRQRERKERRAEERDRRSDESDRGRNRTWSSFEGAKKHGPLAIIVFCFLGVTVGIPLVATVFSLLIAAFATVFSLFIGLGATGVGLIVAGAVSFGSGLAGLAFLPEALLVMGAGLVMIGLGAPLLSFAVWAGKASVRWLIDMVKSLYRRFIKREAKV